MTPTEIGLLTLAVFAWAAVGITRLIAVRFQRDEVFTGVTPGVIPPDAVRAPRARVRGAGQEYAGEIAVSFAPPRGLTPGLVGTVIDGSVDSHDLTGTLVDLATRGHLKMAAVPAGGEPSVARRRFARRPEPDEAPRTDWLLARVEAPGHDTLTLFEKNLLNGFFHSEKTVRMSQLDEVSLQALREAQVGLYREVVERGWYRRHPRQRGGGGCVLIGVGVLVAGLFLFVAQTWPAILAAVLVLGAFVMASRAVRGRTPRTAEGSAVRIQALGFKKYLATAEAEQFKFEEAAGIFSRYLPYAMVFGVAQHWAKVFGDVAHRAQLAGYSGDGLGNDLSWFLIPDGNFGLTDLLFFDSLDGDLDMFGAADALGALGGASVDGLGDVASGLGEWVTGVGDFMGSLDFLDGIGDGCGNLGDGCGDVGCIDF